jgi:hypothetical protein
MEPYICANIVTQQITGSRVDRLVDTLSKGGALSFPHTFLMDNLPNLIDVCSALYRSRRTNLVLVGVLHGNDWRDIEREFSLDNFEYVLEQYARIHYQHEIPVRRKVFPFPAASRLRESVDALTTDLRQVIDAGTAVLTTGDLCHYGHGYAAFHSEPVTVVPHPERGLSEKILSALSALYEKNDTEDFIRQSRALLSDHVAAAMLVKALLGERTALEVFELKFSDYAATLSAERPTLVASVFYGVVPK